MGNSPWLLMGGILVALVNAVGIFLVSRRTKSGSIRTSEAEILWKQSQDMREELRQENLRLRKRIEQLEEKVAALQKAGT